jgi:hypothetical protein
MPLNLVFQIADINTLIMVEEILNIEYNKEILIKKALQKYKTQREAAAVLGCTMRYLNYKLKEFKLKPDETI